MAYNRCRKKGGFQYICDSVKEGRFPQLTTIGTLQSLSVPGYSAICKMCRGRIHFSIASTIIHESCNHICSEVPSIVVALDYGLAPENRLPSQYHDMIDAVLWIKNQTCYLYGVSCSGNISFNSALKLLNKKLEPLCINGAILNQPLFGGKMRIKSEMRLATDPFFPLPVIDVLWDFALPKGTDRDMFFPIG
ncbi:hypothetical protein H5410_037147, partial [Solanum commersonii]